MMNHTPVAYGPLIDVHRRAGAELETVDGWLVPSRYPVEPEKNSDVIVDVSHQTVFEINGPNTATNLRSLYGKDVQVRSICLSDSVQAYRLTDERAVIFGKTNEPQAINVTGGWASIALFGPNRRKLLSKITALDLRDCALPEHHCCQGPIFGVNTLFGRFQNHYELHTGPDSIEFLWEVFLDAGQEFQLQPAGRNFYLQEMGS